VLSFQSTGQTETIFRWEKKNRHKARNDKKNMLPSSRRTEGALIRERVTRRHVKEKEGRTDTKKTNQPFKKQD